MKANDHILLGFLDMIEEVEDESGRKVTRTTVHAGIENGPGEFLIISTCNKDALEEDPQLFNDWRDALTGYVTRKVQEFGGRVISTTRTHIED